jgi:integrase
VLAVHAFRRGLATNLHDVGVEDREIQAILRHSDIRTTQAIYIKSLPAAQVSAMDLIGAALQEKLTCNVTCNAPKGPVN